MTTTPPLDLERLQRSSFVRNVEWHDVLSSTNDRGILAAADARLATPLLILAGRQTAGRGRGSNRWWSADGALTFSLVFDPQTDLANLRGALIPLERWPRIALTAGVALCDLLERHIPGIPYALKWPNDVLLAGKKVSGILIEVPPPAPPAPRRLVLGMGVNVNNSVSEAPFELQSAATAICDLSGQRTDPTELLIDWLDLFASRLNQLASEAAELSCRWRSLCALTGKKIELQSGSRTVQGHCHGIDTDGALLIDTANGPERLYAGVLVRVLE